MELRVEFAEMTIDRFNVAAQDSEEGFNGYFDHDWSQRHATPGAPYVFPEMELECILEEDRCITPNLKD